MKLMYLDMKKIAIIERSFFICDGKSLHTFVRTITVKNSGAS